MRLVSFLLVTCLLTAPALAGPPPAKAKTAKPARSVLEVPEIPYQSFTLPNGLKVIVHSDHAVPIVAVNLWYHVGSRNEQRGRTGFAHLFEHFFFNGSENYPHGFREAMDDLGANNRNGTTSTDRTNFFEDVPVSALERTLYLEADRMGWLAGNLSEAMLKREIGVVSNEKRQGENQPYGRVSSRAVGALYPHAHPYSWSVIGSLEDLQAATMDDIKDWYASYYGPNNAVLSLAGDISLERARELVEKYFGAIPPGPPVSKLTTWVPRLDADVRDQMEDRVPQVRLYRAWHIPGWGTREQHDLELFASVLSGSESAALDRRLVFETGLATGVSAFVWDKQLTSTLFVIVSVKEGADPAEAEREMDAVIARLMKSGPKADELTRAKMRQVTAFSRGIERLGGFGGRSDVLAESLTFGGRPDAYLARFQDFADATPVRVRDTAREWLSRPHYTMTVTPAAKLAATPSDLDRKRLPPLDAPPAVKFPEMQRATLANGLQVILLERHSAPLVNAWLGVDAGGAADPAGAAGTAQLALDLLTRGTRTRSNFQIADELDALGAYIGAGNGADLSSVNLNALEGHLGASLELFADVVMNPAFAPDMVEIQRKQQLAAIGQQKASPFGAAARVVMPLLYGAGHAYAEPTLGYEHTVAALGREQLADWHARWFKPNNATLVVTGAVTLTELMPELERVFGGWQPGAVPAKQVGAGTSPGRGKVHLIDKPGAPQSVIVAAHLSHAGPAAEDLALETVMRNFGQMATSRLNRNLRLEKHWSYGTSGGLSSVRGQRAFTVIAPVQTDKTREAILEVRREIRGVAGERPIAGAEFESIMRSQVARLAGRFETLDALEEAASSVVSLGRDPAYYYDYAENLRGLTADDLNRAAARFVKPKELTWVVIGDLKEIEAGIRALGLGEIVYLDADGQPLQ